MNKSYTAKVIALRGIRKISHLSNKVARKTSHFLDKVEGKSTRILINETGSPNPSVRANVPTDAVIYSSFPHITPIHPALPATGQRPSVTVFAFLDPRGFYGGIATLLCVSATLANELGYDFRVAQTTNFSNNTDVLDFLRSKGITIEKERFSTINLSNRGYDHYAYLPLTKDDVVVVSAWWDAHIAAQLPLQRKFVYLIQDYEPIFYNNSDQQLWAEATYHTEKFIPIINSSILKTYFDKNNYQYISENGVAFEPAVKPRLSKHGETSTDTQNTTKTLFLYGRPSVDRNLFYSAIQAIDLAFQDAKVHAAGWTLYCAGSEDIPDIKLSSGAVIKNKGKMSMQDYYDFAATVDVALSPMLAPHPNYPTLELASLGVPVVTTKWETKQNLDRYSPNILLAEPTAQDMAVKLVEAITMDGDTKKRNTESTNIGADWALTLQPACKQVATKLKQK